MSLNKVMLIGNVGQDPEIRYLDNSQAKVARLRLATTERFTDRNGEPRENTEWHTVTCWRKLADLCEKYIKKGTQIYVEGRLQTREWTDNTGAKRFSTEISADNMQLLGRRSDNSGNGPESPSYGQYGNQSRDHQQGAAAGPGGYQPPYQPTQQAPVSNPNHASAAPVPTPSAAPMNDFNGEGEDDLPF